VILPRGFLVMFYHHADGRHTIFISENSIYYYKRWTQRHEHEGNTAIVSHAYLEAVISS